MSFYEELVIETQRRNYSRYYSVYARGGTRFSSPINHRCLTTNRSQRLPAR